MGLEVNMGSGQKNPRLQEGGERLIWENTSMKKITNGI
jgi:hypothetical protein